MSLISSSGKLILLHKGIESLPKAAKYDFVLSPQFYISKREKLPVKYAFQAKKLAPSILEDLLSDDYLYEYIVQKDGDSWLFFAYAPKEIEEFLKRCCNILPNKIGKIYFADQLKAVLRKLPIGVDEYNALTLINSKATIVPRDMIDGDKYAKFSNRLRPKGGFKFKTSIQTLNSSTELSKSVVALSILIILLGVSFIVDGLSYKSAASKQEAKLDKLYEEYPQLQSKMTRESIKNKYTKIERRERKIRDLLDTFSQLTSKRSVLDSLELKKDSMMAQFNVDSKEINRVIKIAKEAKLKVNKVNNRTVRVEGAIR